MAPSDDQLYARDKHVFKTPAQVDLFNPAKKFVFVSPPLSVTGGWTGVDYEDQIFWNDPRAILKDYSVYRTDPGWRTVVYPIPLERLQKWQRENPEWRKVTNRNANQASKKASMAATPTLASLPGVASGIDLLNSKLEGFGVTLGTTNQAANVAANQATNAANTTAVAATGGGGLNTQTLLIIGGVVVLAFLLLKK